METLASRRRNRNKNIIRLYAFIASLHISFVAVLAYYLAVEDDSCTRDIEIVTLSAVSFICAGIISLVIWMTLLIESRSFDTAVSAISKSISWNCGIGYSLIAMNMTYRARCASFSSYFKWYVLWAPALSYSIVSVMTLMFWIATKFDDRHRLEREADLRQIGEKVENRDLKDVGYMFGRLAKLKEQRRVNLKEIRQAIRHISRTTEQNASILTWFILKLYFTVDFSVLNKLRMQTSIQPKITTPPSEPHIPEIERQSLSPPHPPSAFTPHESTVCIVCSHTFTRNSIAVLLPRCGSICHVACVARHLVASDRCPRAKCNVALLCDVYVFVDGIDDCAAFSHIAAKLPGIKMNLNI